LLLGIKKLLFSSTLKKPKVFVFGCFGFCPAATIQSSPSQFRDSVKGFYYLAVSFESQQLVSDKLFFFRYGCTDYRW